MFGCGSFGKGEGSGFSFISLVLFRVVVWGSDETS